MRAHEHDDPAPADTELTRLEQAVRELRDANERLIIAGLREQELADRATRSETELKIMLGREQLLAKASALLGASLDYATTLQQVARLAVPQLADWCVVELVVEGASEQVAVAHVDPEQERMLRERPSIVTAGADPGVGAGHVLRTGRSAIYPAGREASPDAPLGVDHPSVLREFGARSYMCVPLTTRGQVIGVLSFVAAESGRRFHPEDLALAEELARRSSGAIDNARLYREAQVAIRMRDDVLAVVSHDLRSPLSSILMSAEVLLARTEIEHERLRTSLERIRRSADHMRALIVELVELASIQAGRLVLERSRASLAAIVADVLEMLEPVRAQKALHIETTIAADVPLVLVDKERIARVITNLLTNAIKFTPPEGRVVLTAEVAPGEVRVGITDTGAGIAAADLPNLFEPYWKGAQTGRTGTGLGLYIAKGIVQAHGGYIWVDSDVGEGSTFRFTIPLDVPEP